MSYKYEEKTNGNTKITTTVYLQQHFKNVNLMSDLQQQQQQKLVYFFLFKQKKRKQQKIMCENTTLYITYT